MTRRAVLKVALPAVVVAGAGAAVAIAAIPGSNGVITACRATGSSPPGALRVIDVEASPPQTCTTGETTVTFNQEGPPGPAGPPGPQGDPGPPGDTGGDNSGGTGSPFDTSQPGGPSADIFLSIDGIPGDSDDARHKNQISIESFAFLAKRPSTRTVGAVRFSGLRLDKVYDVSSPRLLAAATSGRHLKNATLTFSTGGGSGTDVLTYRLSDVTVSSYEQGGSNPDAKALGSLEEEIGLSPAKVQVSEKTVNAQGNAGPTVSTTWQVPRSRR